MIILRQINIIPLFFYAFLFFVHPAFAQSADSARSKLYVDMEAGNFYLSPSEWLLRNQDPNEIKIPETIYRVRQKITGYNPTQALDNPLYHNAVYVNLRTRLHITDSTIF